MTSRDRKRNGGYVIVKDMVTPLTSSPNKILRAISDYPDGVLYLRAAHRDVTKAVWTTHAKGAWRYWTLEDAIAIKLVMEEDRPSNPPRIIPWSRRGKRARQPWTPKIRPNK